MPQFTWLFSRSTAYPVCWRYNHPSSTQLLLEDSSTYPRPLPWLPSRHPQISGIWEAAKAPSPLISSVSLWTVTPSLCWAHLHCELCSYVFPSKQNWVWPDSFIFIFPEPEECPIKLGESEWILFLNTSTSFKSLFGLWGDSYSLQTPFQSSHYPIMDCHESLNLKFHLCLPSPLHLPHNLKIIPFP